MKLNYRIVLNQLKEMKCGVLKTLTNERKHVVEFYDSKLFKRDLYRYFPELKLDYASEYTKEADYPLLL